MGQTVRPEKMKIPCLRFRHLLTLACLVIIGFSIYGNSLHNYFVWDDYFLVRNNDHIKDPSFLGNIFTEDVGTGSGKKIGFWRPLQMCSYMLNYAFSGLRVESYHFVNIALHILVAYAFYWCTLLLFGNTLLSFAASLLFLTHPVHTEAVTYIAGRSDSMAALFILLSCIAYLQFTRRVSFLNYVLMCFSFILGLLSREITIVFPLLLLWYHYVYKIKYRVKALLLPFLISAGYIALRYTALKSFLPEAATSTLRQRLPGAFVAFADYLRLLCVPSDLHMEYGNRFFSLLDPRALIGMCLFGAVLGVMYHKRNSSRLIVFSLGWFLLWLLPSLNLFPVNAYMAEHWLYLPSMGIFIIIADIFCRAYAAVRMKAVTVIFLLVLTMLYSFLTIQQNQYWRHPIVFYKRTIRYNPQSARLYGNLGSTYRELGKFEDAVSAYEKALEVDPSFTGAYINLGIAYEHVGNYGAAIKAYESAAASNPDNALAYARLANACYAVGDSDIANSYYEKATALGYLFNPPFPGSEKKTP
ncbi:MAG: tetratricopeptide repeat protein [Candidatus Omnitrophica bacterium]|nr:tetratricopeptide repeat protein [Candidatus Omnitrophota bacterium]